MIRIAVTTQKRMYKAIQYLRALWTLCMTSCSFETRKWNPFSHSVTTYVFNTRNTRFHLLLFHGCFNFNHLWMKATLDYPVFWSIYFGWYCDSILNRSWKCELAMNQVNFITILLINLKQILWEFFIGRYTENWKNS